MKPRFSNQRTIALTMVEVLVVIVVLITVLALLLPALAARKRATQRISCVSNLKQIGLAYRIWEGDHNDKYPMQVSVTNGGAMEIIGDSNAYLLWQTISNQLSSPKILWCPADTNTFPATSFSTGFSDANISYFLNLDADEGYPQMIINGDDNLLVDGKPVRPGILNLWTNQIIVWTKDRHHDVGNIGLADGSVQGLTTEGLQQALQQTGVATNRLAIP
ncbi:MAG: type II secretion system protein [Verrucomicrobiota bacterium]|jgi:type II secretory pathway pseudopilin PulG